jgi:glycosyltransferase involved in cell wall biosynthesis
MQITLGNYWIAEEEPMDFDRVVIVSGQRAAGSLQSVASQIQGALGTHGVAAEVIDVDVLPEFCKTDIARAATTVYLTFSHKVAFPWRQPVVSIMGDHPCHRARQLSVGNSEDAVTAWSDASHLRALRALGFSHRAVFLPHGGPEPTEHVASFDERDIDLLFVGTLGEPTDRAALHAANPGVSPIVPDLAFDTIDAIEQTGAPVLPALLSVMMHRRVSSSLFSRDDFASLMSKIQKIGEVNRRVDILAALPDNVEIVIVSNHLPRALRGRPNIRYLGYINDFDRIRCLMRRSRIVLNATSKFPAGSHDRIWFAMAEGAVVLTDVSLFMQQDFRDGESILYLPQKRLEPEDLEAAAATAKDARSLARLADRAGAIYRDRHTWTRRAPALIEAMWMA